VLKSLDLGLRVFELAKQFKRRVVGLVDLIIEIADVLVSFSELFLNASFFPKVFIVLELLLNKLPLKLFEPYTALGFSDLLSKKIVAVQNLLKRTLFVLKYTTIFAVLFLSSSVNLINLSH